MPSNYLRLLLFPIKKIWSPINLARIPTISQGIIEEKELMIPSALEWRMSFRISKDKAHDAMLYFLY